MTKAIRITFIVAAVMGFVVGAVWGRYKAEEGSSYMQSAGVMSASLVSADFAKQQFEHADGAHARQAVLLEIKILEQSARAAPDSNSEGQLGFAYTRLALIEESAGQTEAARRALDQAREWFKRVRPGQDLTDERMKNALNQWDAVSDKL